MSFKGRGATPFWRRFPIKQCMGEEEKRGGGAFFFEGGVFHKAENVTELVSSLSEKKKRKN